MRNKIIKTSFRPQGMCLRRWKSFMLAGKISNVLDVQIK